MDGERLARFALWLVPGVSARAIDAVRARCGSARAALLGPREDLAVALGPRGARGLAALPGDPLDHAARVEARLAAAGGRILLRGDPGYPALGALPDPPEALCVRGTVADRRAVALVGSRACDAVAREESREIAAGLARAGVSVVSGGARGVDAAAHRGALEVSGHTLVVLGSGVLRPGPPCNRRLFAQVLERGGALLSELPPMEPARPMSFPRRNRLIAALASAVVVVRARDGSGALHTTHAACAIGVPVVARADGGAGCDALIAGGALPFASAAEVLLALGVDAGPRDPILGALGTRGSVTSVAARTGMAPADVARALARLCAAGQVRPGGPGEFVRV